MKISGQIPRWGIILKPKLPDIPWTKQKGGNQLTDQTGHLSYREMCEWDIGSQEQAEPSLS